MTLYTDAGGDAVATIEVIRSRRKTLSLEVKDDGRVLLRAPLRCGERELRSFAQEHRGWIERKLRESAQRRRTLDALGSFSEEELRALQKKGKALFPARCAEYAPKLGVRYGRVSVRRQRSKWGSCSSRGNLNFNCLLLLAPERVLDYVVVHELAHIRYKDHSRAFYGFIESVLPDYRDRIKLLKGTQEA